MKKFITIALSICLFSIVSANAQGIKMAYAVTDSILIALPEYASQMKSLETYNQQMMQQLQQKDQELQAKIADFQQNQNNYIMEVLQQKEMEIRQLQQNLQQFQQQAQAGLQQKQIQLLQPMVEKVKKGIDDVAKEGNYDFVFAHDPVNSFPFIYNNGEDLTQKVIDKLTK